MQCVTHKNGFLSIKIDHTSYIFRNKLDNITWAWLQKNWYKITKDSQLKISPKIIVSSFLNQVTKSEGENWRKGVWKIINWRCRGQMKDESGKSYFKTLQKMSKFKFCLKQLP